MSSLRLRVIVSATFWSMAVLLIAGIVIWRLFAASAERQFDATLEAHLSELASAIAITDRAQGSVDAQMAAPRFHRPLSGLYWQVVSPDGTLLRSRSLWDSELPLPVDDLHDGAVHRQQIMGPDATPVRSLERTVSTPRDGAWRIAVAADSAGLVQEKANFLRSLLISFAVLCGALALAAVAQTALALAPLARLQQAAAMHRKGLSTRIEGKFPDEIAPVVDELNATLANNEKLTARARRRSVDLAHALKTPVAALQNALGELPVVATDPDMEIARDALRRINLQTRRQLALARIAVAPPGPGVLVEPTVERLIRAMTRIHPGKEVTIATAEADARFKGDAEDLEEMLGNLLDNACKWATQTVSVSIETRTPQLEIVIEDDGPGVLEETLCRLAVAGARFDETTEGTGLGLAIVADIVEAYDGNMHFDRSSESGLSVTLLLPSGA